MSNVEFPRDIEKVYWFESGMETNKNMFSENHFIAKFKCKNKSRYVYFMSGE
jgi:hypothetical protein